MIYLFIKPYAALKFNHFLLRQIKLRGNYMEIHYASTFPRQCFCQGWQDFILRASVFTSATSPKTSTRSKLVRLLLLLHISQRISNYVYKYCYMQCSVLFSHAKNSVLKISNALFEFKSNSKYERKMLNRLKRNFRIKIYINGFCLMSQVFFFVGASRWRDDIRM